MPSKRRTKPACIGQFIALTKQRRIEIVTGIRLPAAVEGKRAGATWRSIRISHGVCRMAKLFGRRFRTGVRSPRQYRLFQGNHREGFTSRGSRLPKGVNAWPESCVQRRRNNSQPPSKRLSGSHGIRAREVTQTTAPTRTPAEDEAWFRRTSSAVSHQMTTLDRAKLTHRIGSVASEILEELASGLRAAMDLD